MEKMIRLINSLSLKAALFSSVAMICIVSLILLEVFFRSFLNSSTMISDEYSAYLYVFLVFLGLAYTLATDGHIRVKVILSRLNPRAQSLLDLVATGMGLALTGFAFVFSIALVVEAYRLGMVSETPSQTPMWIPQLAVPFGLALLMGQLMAHGAKALRRWMASRTGP